MVSVVLPTYKRPQLLKRSINSVLNQTYTHWELVISDDEVEEGASWLYVSQLCESDPRIRIVRNESNHGQVGNTNNAILHAKGDWVKLLHDDDVLKPECLHELVNVAGVSDNIACITCGVERYQDGEKVGSYLRSGKGWPLLEVIPQNQIHIAMYLLENTGGAIPSQKMIHRRVFDRGIMMEEPPGLSWMVDSWFNVKIATCGDLVLFKQPLVEWHQGSHETVTQASTDREQERELHLFREMLWEEVRDHAKVPSPEVMTQMTYIPRSLMRFKRMQWKRAFRLLSRVKHPSAYAIFAHWMLHRLTKGRLSKGKRQRMAVIPTV